MKRKTLGIGDPHLKRKTDLGENFEQHILQIIQDRDIDEVIIPGDVIDNLPDQRISQDFEVGKNFFRGLNKADIPVLAVGGNHDYDIHHEITNDYKNVVNLDYNKFERTNPSTTFIGRGAIEFNQGPEIPLETLGRYEDSTKYGETSWDELEEDLSKINEETQYTNLESYFGVEDDDRIAFRDGVDFFREEYNQISELFDNAEGDQIVYINHNVPFNTAVDVNLSGNHVGSLVDKHLINQYKPDLCVSGHLHDGGVDYISQNEKSTTLANLGIRQVAEMRLNDDNSVDYIPLNEPDL